MEEFVNFGLWETGGQSTAKMPNLTRGNHGLVLRATDPPFYNLYLFDWCDCNTVNALSVDSGIYNSLDFFPKLLQAFLSPLVPHVLFVVMLFLIPVQLVRGMNCVHLLYYSRELDLPLSVLHGLPPPCLLSLLTDFLKLYSLFVFGGRVVTHASAWTASQIMSRFQFGKRTK